MNHPKNFGQNSESRNLPNYSSIPALNRVYNSIIPGSGLSMVDVERIKVLISGGISSEVICASFDVEQTQWPSDSVSQAKAIKTAIDRMGLNSVSGKGQDDLHKFDK